MAQQRAEVSGFGDPHTISIDEVAIDTIFKSFDQSQRPGLAVGIAVNGVPRYRKGFGLANMELPLALGTAMRMRIASVSKHFTALAWLLLCEEGRAGLDNPIGCVLPELNPVVHNITPRQLMGHVSGLRDAHDVCWQFNGTDHSASSDQILSFYRGSPSVNAEPGIAWNYNNGCYLILTAAIERICGASLETILRDRIFDPVGMNNTMLRRHDSDFVPNSAALHMSCDANGFTKSYLGSAFAGEGGIVSTIDDMLRWLSHMDAPFVGSPETWALLKAPLILSSGVSTGYGLGLVVGNYRGIETLSHAGGVMGGNAIMMKLPQLGLDIVILANRHDASAPALANAVIDAVCTGLEPQPSASKAPLTCGVFRSTATSRIIQLYGRGEQQMTLIDGEEWQFVWSPDGILIPPAEWSILKQRITLTGTMEKPTSIEFENFGALDRLLPVEPVRAVQVAPVGRYWSKEAKASLDIVASDLGSDVQLRASGPFGSISYELEHLADGIWKALHPGPMPWGGIVRIEDEGQALCFTTARNNALRFVRESAAG